MRRAVAALLLVGCAQNGVLELQIELPPAPEGTGPEPWYGSVQVRRAGAAFGMPWEGDDPLSLELGDASQEDCISVNATEDDFDLEIRVRFCRSPNCLSLLDGSPPERLFRLSHPIYIGRRTYWSTSIAAVPSCVDDADCEAGRCLDGVCGCAADADCCVGTACRCPNPPCYRCEDGPDLNDQVDSCVEVVDRCQIEGCTTGDPSMWCTGDRSAHFCEQATWADRLNTYMCGEP